jgi:hypothetical protein
MFKSDDESQKFLTDTEVTSKMTSAKRLSDVNPSEYVLLHLPCVILLYSRSYGYDAVFYVGGYVDLHLCRLVILTRT